MSKNPTITLGAARLRAIPAPDAPKVGSLRYFAIVASIQRAGLDPFSATLLDDLRTTDGGNRRRILGSSTKVLKSGKLGVKNVVLYLAPGADSGVNFCAFASPGCLSGCLKSTGHMRHNGRARLLKSLYFLLFRADFLSQLDAEVGRLAKAARRAGMVAAVRLNGTSDILWERIAGDLMRAHPDVQFYDYTKAPLSSRRDLPANYHLTFSLSERGDSMGRALEWLQAGHNVAAVVSAKGATTWTAAKRAAAGLIGTTWHGFPCIDGDESDVRFWDAPGSWVVLYAKGAATRDASGFVVRL